MADHKKPKISLRKQPKQARSTELVGLILEAATQVLAREGASRFTTARVAERAGVSVGSVYQYFPNKAAILFRLQSDEWRQTSELLRGILEDTGKSPHERLRLLVHAFVRSECDEAAMRGALGDAAPLYRHAPEAHEARALIHDTVGNFMSEALPRTPEATRALAGALITATFSAVGKQFSAAKRTSAEIDAYADAMADMFCAYLDKLAHSCIERTSEPSRKERQRPPRKPTSPNLPS